jgi:hypothetical protein
MKIMPESFLLANGWKKIPGQNLWESPTAAKQRERELGLENIDESVKARLAARPPLGHKTIAESRAAASKKTVTTAALAESFQRLGLSVAEAKIAAAIR